MSKANRLALLLDLRCESASWNDPLSAPSHCLLGLDFTGLHSFQEGQFDADRGSNADADSHPDFAIGVEALQKHLSLAGYTHFVASCGYDLDQERQQVETLATRGVDGNMLVGAMHSPGLLDVLRSRRVPFVETWVSSNDSRAPSIGSTTWRQRSG